MIRAAGLALGMALVLGMAGCCTGDATHKCDFTPPTGTGGHDAGTDGPVMCGTEVCAVGHVCCVTKAPLNAACIDPSMFQSLGCEKMDLPCVKPTDCPGGMACCVVLSPDLSGGTVSCLPQLQCVAGTTSFIACESNADCPSIRPTCSLFSMTDQGDFDVCE